MPLSHVLLSICRCLDQDLLGSLNDKVAACLKTAIQKAIPVPTDTINSAASASLARLFEYDSIRYLGPNTVLIVLRDHAAASILKAMQSVKVEVPSDFILRLTFIDEDSTLAKEMQFAILIPSFPSAEWVDGPNLEKLTSAMMAQLKKWVDMVMPMLWKKKPSLQAPMLKFLSRIQHNVVGSCTTDNILDVLCTARGTPLKALTPDIIHAMYRTGDFRLVIRTADMNTFILLLTALSNGECILAGRTPFKGFEAFRYVQQMRLNCVESPTLSEPLWLCS